MNWRERLENTLIGYDKGNYSDAEIVYCVILVLGGEGVIPTKELWLNLPEWMRIRILQNVRDVTETSEFFAAGGPEGDERTRLKYLRLQNWLRSQNLL
jgi:hypothetical protein